MSQRLEAEHWIAAPLPRVFAFFADPRNLPRILPASQGARLLKLNLVRPRFPTGETPPGAEQMAGVGTEIIFKFRAIPYVPLHEKWTALITDFSLNQSFRDTQKQGPFRHWAHTHFFEARIASGREGTLIRDVVEYEVGFGVIGTFLEKVMFQRMVRSTFQYRQHVLEKIFQAE
ncbi:MAG: SRPBCC family protein [Terriglobales bacterium]